MLREYSRRTGIRSTRSKWKERGFGAWRLVIPHGDDRRKPDALVDDQAEQVPRLLARRPIYAQETHLETLSQPSPAQVGVVPHRYSATSDHRSLQSLLTIGKAYRNPQDAMQIRLERSATSMRYEAVVLTPDLLKSKPDILAGIARVHASCILIDGTLATFLPPLSPDVLTKWWTERWEEAQRNERFIIIVLSDLSDPHIDLSLTSTSDPAINALPTTIVGVVSLAIPFSQTGPFRGTVEKLLVSPSYRRLGLSRKLMAKLEEVALDRGKTILTLGTTFGTPAEYVYPRLGYQRVGVVENNGIHPLSGELLSDVLFWKDLNRHERILVNFNE
jgi:GNAT superfamily N-acetyltransferase